MSHLLSPRMVERPWGLERLPEPFASPPGKRIGEVWFEPPPALAALLVKYIFTSEALSVQVHPSDQQAPAGKRGKEECWYVLDAQPGARLGIGFTGTIDPAAMRQAALDGSIEALLEWHPVEKGSFFYIPAGTVHAIGPGLALVEIQQNSDMTYRLYDYGRPRELHLDAGMAVARGHPYPAQLRQQAPDKGSARLVDGPHFRLDLVEGQPDRALAERYQGPLLAIPLEGLVQLGDELVRPGQCAHAPALDALRIAGRCLIAQPLA